jgi:hypothetical protein
VASVWRLEGDFFDVAAKVASDTVTVPHRATPAAKVTVKFAIAWFPKKDR